MNNNLADLLDFVTSTLRSSLLFTGLFIILFQFSSCSEKKTPIADLILHNANILTIDKSFSKAKTLIIKDGQIIHVGKNAQFKKYVGPETKVIDINGKTVLPGFIEPHTHPVASSTLYDWHDVSGMSHNSAKAALRSLKKAIKGIPEGEWVLAFGWDFMLLDGAFPLTKEYLDKNLSSKHPIWIMMQSMHTHYFNSMALDMVGITNDTPAPLGGGHYEKDKKGNLTGIATESATVAPMLNTFPRLTQEGAKRAIRKMYRRYNSSGITTVGTTGMVGLLPGQDAFNITQQISKEEPLTIRMFHYGLGMPGLKDSCITNEDLSFRDIGKKYWIDGSPYTGSMLIEEPYLSSELNQSGLGIKEHSVGASMFPSGMYYNMFKSAIEKNWQLSVHVQGDSAATIAIQSLKPLLKEKDAQLKRHRFEHLALVKKEQLVQMHQIGITPSFHINHIYYYGDSLQSSIIGNDRANRLMPVQSAIDAGHIPSLHNDSPMYPPNPLLAVRTAVTRMTSSGQVLGADEAISVEDALRSITINAAWQMHAEDKIGSLEKGKVADFVILEQDPTEINPEEIHSIRIMATYLSGKKII